MPSLKTRFKKKFVEAIVFLFDHLSYSFIQKLGYLLGSLLYYGFAKYRKRVLSNLSLAKDLNLNEKDLKKTAIASLRSLATAFLEFPKFYHEKEIQNIAYCKNPEVAKKFIDQGQGVIFFCAHQANWELFFLEGCSRMPGVAIGRKQNDQTFYDFVLKVRTRFGGKIIEPKNAMKEGVKALKEGKFLGIVGDQGMPESAFQSNFLGAIAHSTTAPALLSFKTQSPMIVAMMTRKEGRYEITYSEPLIPDYTKPLKEEVHRLTIASLNLLEESIKKNPSEWLWIHNRFKLETAQNVFYPFRHDTILIAVNSMKKIRQDLIKTLYPKASIYYYSLDLTDLENETIKVINSNLSLPKDYRFKFVINLTEMKKISLHFKKLAAIKVLNCSNLDQIIKKRGFGLPKQFDEKIILALARNPLEILKTYAM